MNFGGSGYGLVTVIGAFALLAVLIWAVLRNRGARGTARTERATHDLYEEINREDKDAGRLD